MENGLPTIGFEDVIIDVEGLLVEPHDGHFSVDSVICLNEKIPPNAMHMEGVSRSFGVTDTGIAPEGEGILSDNVLDAMHNEVEDGYFRLQNDFYGMGEEYFLGDEFAESITNLDYTSTEGLQTSVSDSQLDIDFPWKADIFGIAETSEKSTSFTLQDIGKFHDISSCSFHDVLSDENDTGLSPSVEILCGPKNERNGEFGLTGQCGETDRFHVQNALVPISARAIRSAAIPRQKRSHKPTKRYIDELADHVLRHPKRRREVSSSNYKDKSLAVKGQKKCHMKSMQEARLPAEECSVKAIQVPFGSLMHKECPKSPDYDVACSSDRGNPTTASKDNCVITPEDCKQTNDFTTSALPKRRDHGATSTSWKNGDSNVTKANLKKKRSDLIMTQIQKQRDDCVIAVNPKKQDNHPTEESSEEVSGRRKHHRLWTNAEIRTLIDGVSEHGVGRWTLLKKLFFSASAHRTSVDLKDKWRNLLKASGIQGKGSRQGKKKRNLGWQPLPKSVMHRVCELASMYPYPKGQTPKIGHFRHVSPDTSTDITLSDYRRILRNTNEN